MAAGRTSVAKGKVGKSVTGKPTAAKAGFSAAELRALRRQMAAVEIREVMDLYFHEIGRAHV